MIGQTRDETLIFRAKISLNDASSSIVDEASMDFEDADPMSENCPGQKFNNEVSSDIIDFVDMSKNGSFYFDRNQTSSDQRPVSITGTQYTTSMLSHALFSFTKKRECVDSNTAENSRSYHLQRAACKLPENVIIAPPQNQDNDPTPDLPCYSKINHLANISQTQSLNDSRSLPLPQMLHRPEAPIHVLASFQQREAAGVDVAPWTMEIYEKRLAEDVAATGTRRLSNNDHQKIYDPSFSNVQAQRKRQRRKLCDRVEELRFYKMKHGHIRVSSKEDPRLFKFCTKIRCTRRNHGKEMRKCCRHDLKPAEIPRDPLDDNWDDSVALEKEIAWLVEESKVLLPTSASGILSENKPHLPIVLDFAWRHGSLELREKMRGALLYKWNGVEGNTVIDLTLVDGIDLIESCTGSQPDPGSEKIIRLRKEACSALQLGYRRSECIEKDLNEIQGLRWRQSVEEVGEPGDGKGPLPTNKFRQRRKRPTNAALLQAAGHSLVSPSCSQSDAEVASQIPSLLTPIENEIAWLVEESLILLPKDMIDNHNASSTDSTKIELMVSAGLITQCEINWEYVTRNASENLKDKLVMIGGIKCRPLQRIIRWQQREVKVAFQKRRSNISLLLLRGYRRHETKLSLPSHELLVETGLFNVWAVRQMRRRQNEVAEESVSANDLRLACNERLGDTHQPAKSPKRQKCLSHTSITPTKSHVAKVAFFNKARSSTLTAEEEEIAWVSGRV